MRLVLLRCLVMREGSIWKSKLPSTREMNVDVNTVC